MRAWRHRLERRIVEVHQIHPHVLADEHAIERDSATPAPTKDTSHEDNEAVEQFYGRQLKKFLKR
jgi:hypothetical protein